MTILAAIDVQLERLLDGLRPGQPKATYAGWGREMRALYGHVDPEVLRGAVTRCLALEEHLPTPAQFREYVTLAERHLERRRREATIKLVPPAPDPAAEWEAERRAEAAKEAARQRLAPHLRKEWRR